MKVTFTHKKLLEDLFSTKDSVVVSALNELRKSGDTTVIPYLVELYVSAPSDIVKSETEKFLKDLKDDEAAKPLSEALGNPKYKNNLEVLTAICWQANIDFSPYIDSFTKIAIEGDYQTSLEAFTVIEEALPNISQTDIRRHISYLKNEINKIDKNKIPLIKELIISLENAL